MGSSVLVNLPDAVRGDHAVNAFDQLLAASCTNTANSSNNHLVGKNKEVCKADGGKAAATTAVAGKKVVHAAAAGKGKRGASQQVDSLMALL